MATHITYTWRRRQNNIDLFDEIQNVIVSKKRINLPPKSLSEKETANSPQPGRSITRVGWLKEPYGMDRYGFRTHAWKTRLLIVPLTVWRRVKILELMLHFKLTDHVMRNEYDKQT